jgi:hypothetical protein
MLIAPPDGVLAMFALSTRRGFNASNFAEGLADER